MKHLTVYKLFENNNEYFSNFISDKKLDIDFRYEEIEVSELVGEIITHIIINEDKTEMIFVVESQGGYEFYKFYHEQDCCESVELYDVNGDLNDMIDEVVIKAEEVRQEAKDDELQYDESGTWTFYKFATSKGYITLRWLGESNGYYSEVMSFVKSNTIIESHEELEKLLA